MTGGGKGTGEAHTRGPWAAAHPLARVFPSPDPEFGCNRISPPLLIPSLHSLHRVFNIVREEGGVDGGLVVQV